MVVGGLAASYHGIARATFDIDLVIAVDHAALRVLVQELRALGFDLRLRDAQQLLQVSNCIPTFSAKGLRLDLWLVRSGYDRVAFGRRQRGTFWPGRQAWIASPEDTILSKLLAGRARDAEDTIGIITVQQSKLDQKYLTSWARRLDLAEALRCVQRRQIS